MLLIDRIKSFETLGIRLKNLSSERLNELFVSARNENAWFIEDNIKLAIEGICLFLKKSEIEQWLSAYDLEKTVPKRVGLITAGNIPLVGFHDLMCVLLSGHQLMLKISTKDQTLMRFILDELIDINSDLTSQIKVVERLNDADAFIGTGSDNTSRYFEYYFKSKPHVIRKNRTSVAILTGEEARQDFENLGQDIFQYYGLGCRNVSKIFVPKGYNFNALLDGLKPFDSIADHHKYRNNYDYNKSIYLVNGEPHLDTEFLLVRESQEMVSPISVLYYQEYTSETELESWLQSQETKIQCIVGSSDGQIPFGQAQKPRLSDYADGVDTMRFLCELN